MIEFLLPAMLLLGICHYHWYVVFLHCQSIVIFKAAIVTTFIADYFIIAAAVIAVVVVCVNVNINVAASVAFTVVVAVVTVVAAAAVENPISCINVEKKSETFFLVHDTFITSFGTSLKLGKPH